MARILVGVALGIGGCGDEESLELAPGEPATITTVTFGLEQSLEVSTLVLESGGLVLFQSTLTNGTQSPMDVESRICNLDITTSMSMERPGAACAAFSQQATLQPGEGTSELDVVRFRAPPGVYPVTVIHALDPPVGLTLEIEILNDGPRRPI